MNISLKLTLGKQMIKLVKGLSRVLFLLCYTYHILTRDEKLFRDVGMLGLRSQRIVTLKSFGCTEMGCRWALRGRL